MTVTRFDDTTKQITLTYAQVMTIIRALKYDRIQHRNDPYRTAENQDAEQTLWNERKQWFENPPD